MSPVSNHVYERRLIEKYIAENGTDPVNNQPLSEEQLIDIKGAGIGNGSGHGAPGKSGSGVGNARSVLGFAQLGVGCQTQLWRLGKRGVKEGWWNGKGKGCECRDPSLWRIWLTRSSFLQSPTRSAPSPPRPPASRPS